MKIISWVKIEIKKEAIQVRENVVKLYYLGI